MSAPKYRPIIMSDSSVLATLEGRKTMTRRVITKANSEVGSGRDWSHLDLDGARPDLLWMLTLGLKVPCTNAPPEYCPECWERVYPRWEVGDRLWVRETWRPFSWWEGQPIRIEFRAGGPKHDCGAATQDHEDWEERTWIRISDELAAKGIKPDRNGEYHFEGENPLRWRSPIYMPRWASRITLEVTDVRPERLWDISEDDVLREGITLAMMMNHVDSVAAFADEWDRLNAKRGHPWESNPWVWTVSYRMLES